MADVRERVPESVPGTYYVDYSCIYCDLCRETAPSVFREEKEYGWARIFHQPSTPEEVKATLESMQGCPTGSIGSGGDQFDWQALPSHPVPETTAAHLTYLQKPWWKFW